MYVSSLLINFDKLHVDDTYFNQVITTSLLIYFN